MQEMGKLKFISYLRGLGLATAHHNLIIAVLWDVAPYSVVKRYEYFGETYCVILSVTENFIITNQTTRRKIPTVAVGCHVF
jgi:hypothetical protein